MDNTRLDKSKAMSGQAPFRFDIGRDAYIPLLQGRDIAGAGRHDGPINDVGLCD